MQTPFHNRVQPNAVCATSLMKLTNVATNNDLISTVQHTHALTIECHSTRARKHSITMRMKGMHGAIP